LRLLQLDFNELKTNLKITRITASKTLRKWAKMTKDSTNNSNMKNHTVKLPEPTESKICIPKGIRTPMLDLSSTQIMQLAK